MPDRLAALLRRKGQVLVGVILVMLMMMIIVPAMVVWVQQESRISVKDKRSTVAFNLAEAAVERGMWKLKSSTSSWIAAQEGQQISGYHFDTTYTDVSGGSYRINFSSLALNGLIDVMVWGEGRDDARKETRSIQAVFQNTIPGAIIAGGTLQEKGTAIVHWGPVLALDDITMSGNALNRHYPRALSKQVVHPYDTNGLTPPNTDNLEWWSDYNVPELPIFDFAALRSSASATNTLNCNGKYNSSIHQVPCGSSCTNCNVLNMYRDNRYDDGDVWYWDNNVILNGTGINGTVIVRGNLTVTNEDWYGSDGPLGHSVNMHVPATAWMEYQKIDTSSKNQYPADKGYQSSNSTYILGSCGSTCEGSASGSDLGFYGFLYVGGDANFAGAADIYGATWVVGDWYAAGDNIIFYNDTLSLPTINVSLQRESWQEVSPSSQAWP